MKKTFISAIILGFFTTLAFAHEIDGKWKGALSTDSGTFESSKGIIEFENGEISGKKFEYTYNWDRFQITHHGELIKDDEMKIKWTFEYYEGEIIFKRVKK